MDRALASGARGCAFESRRGRHIRTPSVVITLGVLLAAASYTASYQPYDEDSGTIKGAGSMTSAFNPIGRVHTILSRAVYGHAPDTIAAKAWSKAFGLEGDNTIERQFEVTELLRVFYQEVQLAERAVATHGFRKEQYDRIFSNIYPILDPVLLSARHDHSLQSVAGVLDRLELIADVIPDDGRVLDPDELTAFVEQLETLKQDVCASSLPLDVQRFFLEQIGIMLRALRAYPIAGNKVFGDALGEIIASRFRNDEAFKKAEQHEEAQPFLERYRSAYTWWMARVAEGTGVIALAEFAYKMLTSGS